MPETIKMMKDFRRNKKKIKKIKLKKYLICLCKTMRNFKQALDQWDNSKLLSQVWDTIIWRLISFKPTLTMLFSIISMKYELIAK